MIRSRYDKQILHLALPALGTLAADPLVSLVDTAFVGRLGALPLAALGVNVALFSLAFFIFNFLAYGTTPMIGRALGQGDRAQAGRLVIQALYLALLLGTLSLITLQLLAGPLLTVMGASAELLSESLVYLRIRALAAPAVLLITAAHGIYRGFQDTRTPFVISLWLNLLNIVLDALLIFGLGWGLAGAAWATAAAQYFGALAFLYLIFKRQGQTFELVLLRPSLAELLPFLRIGGHLFMRTTSLILTFTLATAVATRTGTLEVAAHQVASQLWLFMALVMDALAIAGQSLIARYLGEGKTAEARALANRLLIMALYLGAALMFGFSVLRPILPRLFTDDPALIAMILSVFPFVILMQPLNALVFTWDGIFIGAEDFAFLAWAMVISAVTASSVLLLVLPLDWGLTGVWWGLVVLVAVRLLTLAYRYWWAKSPLRV